MNEYITIDATGRYYYKDKGKTILHREDGPAIEYSNGAKIWCLNDVQHRMDGPAAELSNGSRVWIINDVPIFEVNELGKVKRKLK